MEDRKIYTKTGDKGKTSLLGGKRVPKCHTRIEAYGSVDELNSFVGLLRDQDIDPYYKNVLLKIQERLFVAESILASDDSNKEVKLPCLKEEDILYLENEIDKMNEKLPPLKNFILPGGHTAVSLAHVARTVCRRGERSIIQLSEQYPVQETVLRYFNRLSDYFFVLARKIGQDSGVGDHLWKAERCD